MPRIAPGIAETTDPTADFFDALARRDHEPLLARTSGTVRFDVVDGARTRHWYVTVSNGDVKVSHQSAPADASLRVDKAFFDEMVGGRANAMAAILRGTIVPEGDLGLLLLLERLFPGPDGGSAV
jgi:hypothetical protein